MLVRPRSALGLKYVQITPGQRRRTAMRTGRRSRSGRPRRSRSRSTRSSTCSTRRRARPQQQNLDEFGNALAGRGGSTSTRSSATSTRCCSDLTPVLRNLAGPAHPARQAFRGARAAPRREVAPVAETQASLFRNLDTTFIALDRRRPAVHPGGDPGGAAGARSRAIRDFPQQRPFLRNSTALFTELRPGVRALRADRARPRRRVRPPARRRSPRPPALNQRLADVFIALARLRRGPASSTLGINA